jgi:Lrp/AsnC family leucine-responsive transcriptional regulator
LKKKVLYLIYLKILSKIINNARLSSSKLSKELSFSREVIEYRLRKLEKDKIILGYQARLNLSAFSMMGYNILIKLRRYDSKMEEKFILMLKNLQYTHYIAKIGGDYDLIIGFSIKKTNDLRIFLEKIYNNYSDLIEKHELLTMLFEIKDNFGYIVDKNRNEDIKSFNEKYNEKTLDKIDRIIIKELTKNARISAIEIANKLSMTGAAIAYRIKKIEKNNLILGYRTLIDLDKFDFQYYYIFFDLQEPNFENENKIISEIKFNKNIIWGNKIAGSHSFSCMFYSKNNNEFYSLLKEFQNRNPFIIKIKTYTYLDSLHHNYIPFLLIECIVLKSLH